MSQYQQMQQVIDNYKKNFGPQSYKYFVTFGISPQNIAPNSYKELPQEKLNKIKQILSVEQEQTDTQNTSPFQEYSENDGWIYFGNRPIEHISNKAKYRIYIPIKEDASHDYIMSESLNILINSNTLFTGKVAKTFRNDSLLFELESLEHAQNFANQFLLKRELKNSLGVHNPFIKDIGGLGIVDMTGFNPVDESYTLFVAKQMEEYVFEEIFKNGKAGLENANIDGFRNFLAQSLQNSQENFLIKLVLSEIDNCKAIDDENAQSLK